MRFAFHELVDVAKLQELTDALYRAARIPSSIITTQGEILTGSGWQRICTSFHRKHPEIERACIESDTCPREAIGEAEGFAIYECPMGLIDARAPIVIEGEHLANVFAGQVLFEAPGEALERRFREQARRYGLDEQKYLAALREVPVFQPDSFRDALRFLTKLAQLAAGLGLTRKRELEAADRARLALLSIAEDERSATQALRASEERFRGLFASMREGFAVHEIICDGGGRAVDYRFLDANAAFFASTGLPRDILGRTVLEVMPDTERFWIETYGRVALTGEPAQFEHFAGALDKHFEVSAFSPAPRQFATVFLDVTERRRAEEERERLVEEIRGLAARLSEAEEVERQRLARELHDRVGQGLTALGLNVSLIRGRLSPTALQRVEPSLDAAARLIGEIVGEVRQVMTELRPPMLDEYGLLAALVWYGEQFGERSGIGVTVTGHEPVPRLGADIEVALFRIVQEALTNVAKHAGAGSVEISLQQEASAVRLCIVDDGCGIDVQAARCRGIDSGWGMRIMRERAVAVGGDMRVSSQPRRGTTVEIVLQAREA